MSSESAAAFGRAASDDEVAAAMMLRWERVRLFAFRSSTLLCSSWRLWAHLKIVQFAPVHERSVGRRIHPRRRRPVPGFPIGAQAAGAAAYPASLIAGEPVPLRTMRTMADGIAVGRPGDVPFALIRDLVDDVRVVSEDSLARAQVLLLERAKMVVEPAGAAAVAAILDDPTSFAGPVVATLSGGNVDPLLLMRVIRHGLAAAGRYTTLTLRMPDHPGSLAALLQDIGAHGANVVDVRHTRIEPRLSIDEVEIAIELETRGPTHRDEVVQDLRARGYEVAG